MIEKLTNITQIPKTTVLEKVIEGVNDNFRTMNERFGLQFTTVTVTINKNDWYDNMTAEKVEDVDILDNDEKTLDNPTKIPVARVCIRVNINNPNTDGVKYTDVIVAPHIADSAKCIEQLKMITQSGAIFVNHTAFSVYDPITTPTCGLKLMFWAMTSKPTTDLDFDVILI